jgi:hypothetical protein
LAAIATERGQRFDQSFKLVDQLLKAWGEPDLAERLYAATLEHPWGGVADLFGILAWTTSDNGAAMMRTMERWLRENKAVRKLQIALYQDAYPFLKRDEMENVLQEAARRHPEVAERCSELIRSRRRDDPDTR